MGRWAPAEDHEDMTDPPADSVVVGVDGSDDATRAIRWAAAHAALEKRPLAIVHSADPEVLRQTAWLETQGIDHATLTEAFDRAAVAVLDQARKTAQAIAPDVGVSTHLVREDARVALTDASASARLVVVGSRGRGPLRSALLGSVSASVAKHAACPVVVCRPSDDGGRSADRVVVGADGTEASTPVLEFALAQASLHQLPLTVMHCFWDVLAATRPGVVRVADEWDQSLDDLRQSLAESVAGLSDKYPEVLVTQELARGLVDDCLADHAPPAALLVVGRSSPTGWRRLLHTSCGLAVLERARTTVAVVPESTRGEEP
jgi:nucleotide-binding universal stress UspA family protein